MKDFLEIQFWRVAIWILKKGYGANCRTSDLDDFPEEYKSPKDVFSKNRCGSCRAKETINWIEDHIKLIEMFK